MTLTSDQRKALVDKFQPLFPRLKIFIYDTPTGISVQTPQQTIVELIKDPKTYDLLLLVGEILTQKSVCPVNRYAPNVVARDVVAIASVLKEQIATLQAQNERLMEIAMAGVKLTEPHE